MVCSRYKQQKNYIIHENKSKGEVQNVKWDLACTINNKCAHDVPINNMAF